MPLGRPSDAKRLARFWARVDKTAECWIWTGSRTTAGYGHVLIDRRAMYAHRRSYELAHGPIALGLEIDHLCRNRACVNPAHLEPVTHAENMRRGNSHWRAVAACPQGHPYTPENTYVNQGRRNCRACAYARGRAWRLAHPEESRLSGKKYRSTPEARARRNERQRERRRRL